MPKPNGKFESIENNLQTLASHRAKLKKRLAQAAEATRAALYYTSRAEHYRKLVEDLELELTVGPLFQQIEAAEVDVPPLGDEPKPASSD